MLERAAPIDIPTVIARLLSDRLRLADHRRISAFATSDEVRDRLGRRARRGAPGRRRLHRRHRRGRLRRLARGALGRRLSRGRIVVERGGRVESEHRFVWRLADGDHDEQAFLRSAAKPLQALPAVSAGVLERLGLDDRHLALACASHGGSPEHVARVSEILAAAGLGVGHLACGVVAPRDPVAAAALPGRAAAHPPQLLGQARARRSRCCVRRGLAGRGLPRRRASAAARDGRRRGRRAGASRPRRTRSTAAGCSTFHAPLAALARAFGRLASGELGCAGDARRRRRCARTRPSSPTRARSTPSSCAATPVIAKIGAEGVIAIGCEDGRGVAVKVADGALRALDPAAVWAARRAARAAGRRGPRSRRWRRPRCATRATRSSGASPVAASS